MKIGFLETGAPPPQLGDGWASYPEMMRQMLAEAGHEVEAVVFDVRKGELPEGAEGFDGFMVTGSPAGVYDDLPWIAPLKTFLQEVKGQTKLVGICFGHQVMADAFGGKVVKSDKGWGVGLHRYEVVDRAPWMDDAVAVSVPVSHQDQVVEAPPGTRVVARSDFTPFGVLAYEDHPAISFQHHPEFAPEFTAALIQARRGTALPEEVAVPALASLEQPNDNHRVGAWIGRFLAG